jgi:hypothetical protein
MDDRISDPWGERTPYGRGEEWPVRVDENLPAGEPELWGCESETEIQLKWLRTRMKQAAPQALVVA